MSNSLDIVEIDIGTQSLDHTGLKISGGGASSTKIGIDVSLSSAFSGIGITSNIVGAGRCFVATSNSTATSAVGFEFTGLSGNQAGKAFSSIVSRANSTFHIPMSLTHTMSATTTNKTQDSVIISISRSINQDAITLTDNYEVMKVLRSTTLGFGGTSTFNSSGSVGNFENSVTETQGTVNDDVDVMLLTQSALSTGSPLAIIQNAVVSTNFRKIVTEENTGNSFWVSDGTTPNGNLSGTAGDKCLAGPSGQSFVCLSGSIWISPAQIANRVSSAVDYNPSILTADYIISITDTTVPRSVTISTEDIQSGSTANPREFVIKDESGGAGTNNITISGETGNIDGGASVTINQNYGSFGIYSDGTNLFTK
jgi:hypothetical protein